MSIEDDFKTVQSMPKLAEDVARLGKDLASDAVNGWSTEVMKIFNALAVPRDKSEEENLRKVLFLSTQLERAYIMGKAGMPRLGDFETGEVH